jgi:tetratricopeptide (TPR) repeat protein
MHRHYLLVALAMLCVSTLLPQEQPVTLLPGLGTWHHPIATQSAEAQKYFDQGLILLYGFNRYEALRSFRKSASLDPTTPMPLWGEAMAQGPHINMDLDGDVAIQKSCEAVSQANKIRASSDKENAWVAALESRCRSKNSLDYINAMSRLAQRYPDDLDIQTFYAESLMIPVRWRWYERGQPANGVTEAAEILQGVLRRRADHPGANHLYLHLVESSSIPERAIPSAQVLMGSVPSAGHLVHMPGHIWYLLGDFETTATLNERAAELDRRYMQTTGVRDSAYLGYYLHNLHFIAVARSMQGQKANSMRASDQLQTAIQPLAHSMPEMVDAFAALPWLMRVRFRQWEEIQSMPLPAPSLQATAALSRFARALAFCSQKNTVEAAKERRAFDDLRAKIPAQASWLNNRSQDVLAVAAQVMAARIANSADEAIRHWQEAIVLEERLTYDEPTAASQASGRR